MQIELKVDTHPSDRLTLKRRNQNDMQFKDYPAGPLFGNTDAGVFYRAVAQELALLNAQGHVVTYTDTDVNLDAAVEAGTESRTITAEITRIKIDTSANLKVIQGTTPRLVLHAADKRDLPKMISSVSGNTLTIGVEPIVLNNVSFGGIHISGMYMSSKISTVDVTLELPQLADIKIKGSGNVTYHGFKQESIEVDITGSGNVNMKGEANSIDVNISGSGEVDAVAVQAKKARLKLSGSGRVCVTASDSVKARLLGSGQIKIAGSPTHKDTDCTGSGSIKFI